MPTVRRDRVLAAPPEAVWRVVGDAHHLPRWWPRVKRVEGVDAGHWTTVMMTEKGKSVRSDFRLLDDEPASRRSWEQEVEDSPFERILASARTEISLAPIEDEATRVTIEVRQKLRGLSRFGGFLVRRATRQTLDSALDALEATCAR